MAPFYYYPSTKYKYIPLSSSGVRNIRLALSIWVFFVKIRWNCFNSYISLLKIWYSWRPFYVLIPQSHPLIFTAILILSMYIFSLWNFCLYVLPLFFHSPLHTSPRSPSFPVIPPLCQLGDSVVLTSPYKQACKINSQPVAQSGPMSFMLTCLAVIVWHAKVQSCRKPDFGSNSDPCYWNMDTMVKHSVII